MAIKKPLELTSTPPEIEEESAEARYEGFARRLELTTKSGGIHKEFSHQTGTVQVDQEGLEEYRHREEAERLERTRRARAKIEQENAKIDLYLNEHDPQAAWDTNLDRFRGWGKGFLAALVVFFSLRAIAEIFSLATGRPAPGLWSYLAVAILAGIGYALHLMPHKVARIGARLGYATLLIYFGVLGVMRILYLITNPPAAGLDILGTGYGLISFSLNVILFLAALSAFRWAFRKRRELLSAMADCDHPLCERYPFFLNKDNARHALYALEAAMFTGVLLALTVFALGFNVFLLGAIFLEVPAMTFFYLYPFFAYFFFRKIFYPAD